MINLHYTKPRIKLQKKKTKDHIHKDTRFTCSDSFEKSYITAGVLPLVNLLEYESMQLRKITHKKPYSIPPRSHKVQCLIPSNPALTTLFLALNLMIYT